jgi:hypothetical protein
VLSGAQQQDGAGDVDTGAARSRRLAHLFGGGALIRLINTGNLHLVVGAAAGRIPLNGFDATVFVVVGVRPRSIAISWGWGFDDEVPVRPWPQWWRLPGGGGVAWLGFFAAWRT